MVRVCDSGGGWRMFVKIEEDSERSWEEEGGGWRKEVRAGVVKIMRGFESEGEWQEGMRVREGIDRLYV